MRHTLKGIINDTIIRSFNLLIKFNVPRYGENINYNPRSFLVSAVIK